jgi:hypothetical protein
VLDQWLLTFLLKKFIIINILIEKIINSINLPSQHNQLSNQTSTCLVVKVEDSHERGRGFKVLKWMQCKQIENINRKINLSTHHCMYSTVLLF